jgi:hypothetical protein
MLRWGPSQLLLLLLLLLLTYLLTYLVSDWLIDRLTDSMQQNPSWEGNRFAGSQEIPRILWNPKVRYRIHNSPPPVLILSQLEPVHTSTSYFLRLSLPSDPFPQVSPPKLWISLSSIRATCPAHLILLDFITRTVLSGEHRSLRSSLCSFFHSTVTSTLLLLLLLLFLPSFCYGNGVI